MIDTILKPFRWFTSLCLWLSLAIAINAAIFMGGYYVYSNQYVYDKTRSMYLHIVAQSGQRQDALPLLIVESPQVNAYVDGYQIVMYTGLIDQAESYDEIALVLGHELAHQNLKHLTNFRGYRGVLIQELEANADKLGAFYVIKAGYDVCKGRKFWKRMRDTRGNSLLSTHPNYSYRYDELDINCED